MISSVSQFQIKPNRIIVSGKHSYIRIDRLAKFMIQVKIDLRGLYIDFDESTYENFRNLIV